MLSWKISTDPAVASLSCDGARLLYTWLIPHADNLGRLAGEPDFVKASVLPLQKSTTTKQVGAWLGEMAEVGLIQWYETDGLRYISLNGWEKHQHMHSNIKRISDLPPPTEQIRTPYVSLTSESVAKGEGEVEGEVEVNTCTDELVSQSGDITPARWKEEFKTSFWPVVHTERRQAKEGALAEWMALKPRSQDTLDLVCDSMEADVAGWVKEKTEPKHIPHARKWLKDRRYLDHAED
jgi:hypothetical protein